MKKNILVILFIMCFIATSSLIAQDEHRKHLKINIDNSSEYLPFYLDDIHLGMSIYDFESLKDTLFLKSIIPDSPYWLGFIETVEDEKIDKVIYKFDTNVESINVKKPLFQINIIFRLIEQADKFVREKFGKPLVEIDINNKQWILRTNKNYVLIVKQQDNQVVLIATIAGAEWDPDD